MKRFAKGLLLAAVTVVTALGLTACGKEKEPEEENWEYAATFKEKTLSTGTGYICSKAAADDGIYLLESIYDEKSESTNFKLHILNLETLEDTVTDLGPDITEGGYTISRVIPDKDGRVYFFTEKWNADNGSNSSYLVEYKNGNVLSKLDLSLIKSPDDWISPDTINKKDDLFYVTINGEIIGFDTKGKIVSRETAGYHVALMVSNPSGDIVCAFFNEAGESLGSIGAGGKVDKTLAVGNVNGNVFAGKNGKVYNTGDTAAKEFDLNTGETKLLWNWLDIDVNDRGVFYIGALDNGDYRVIAEERGDDGSKYTVCMADLNYRKVTAANSKETVVYGCVALEDKIKENIRRFNKRNDKYKIKVKSYMDIYGDYNKAQEMLQTDIVAGKQIDVFLVGGYDYVKYRDSGLLKDISSYYDKDLNKSDYFGNVFDIFSLNGKQYAIPASFSLDTAIVSETTAAGRTSWTIKDILELRKQNPKSSFLDEGSRDTALNLMLTYTLSDFVDYTKADCKFDTDEFKQLLEFAMTFPEEIDYSTYDGWTALRTGDALIAMASLWNPGVIETYDKLLDNKSVLIGFPSSDGNGNRIRASLVFAVSTKSKHTDGAWEFIKSFLDQDYQTGDLNAFPVLLSAYTEMLNGYMEGKREESQGNGHITLELKGITSAEEAKVRAAIESANAGVFYDNKILEIVQEESQGYFLGQKTVDEVATIVQSRVKIYLQEKQ